MSDLLATATPGAVQALEPQRRRSQTPCRPQLSRRMPPIMLGSDLAETIGARVGDSRARHQPARRD